MQDGEGIPNSPMLPTRRGAGLLLTAYQPCYRFMAYSVVPAASAFQQWW
jgi:hypothetical protein